MGKTMTSDIFFSTHELCEHLIEQRRYIHIAQKQHCDNCDDRGLCDECKLEFNRLNILMVEVITNLLGRQAVFQAWKEFIKDPLMSCKHFKDKDKYDYCGLCSDCIYETNDEIKKTLKEIEETLK